MIFTVASSTGAILVRYWGESHRAEAEYMYEANATWVPPPAAVVGCPCISYPWNSSDAFVTPGSDPETLTVTLNNATGDGQNEWTYPTSYGVDVCASHDLHMHPYCANSAGTAFPVAPAWCSNTWCFVDPNNCNMANDASSYFPGSDNRYSYATCGAAHEYLGADGAPVLTGALNEPTNFLQHYVYSRQYELLSAFLGLFIIVIYGMVFEGIALQLAHYENHRTQAEFDDALILKNFGFQFLNNYWALIYIAYMREIPDPFTKKSHPCEEGTCMSELQFQLLVVFSFKTIGKQIGFTLRPFVYKAIKLLRANRQLSKALSATTGVTTGVIKKIPGGEAAIAQAAIAKDKAAAISDSVLDAALGEDIIVQQGVGLNKYEVQDSLMTYTGTFNDFNDRTVQFGYIVLFAPAFPLAPLLAFVNNIIEMRAAGYKLCHGYRRPVVKPRDGLGTWILVLNTLGFLAVIMNSTMINFVGRQNARSFGVPDSPGMWEDGHTTQYNEDLAGGTGVRLENNSGLSGRANVAALWLRFLVVEHCSMAVRILILFLTPDLPDWIKTARETLEFRTASVYQTNQALELEKQHREKYEEKLSGHLDDIKTHLEAALHVETLKGMFDRIDADGSGFLSVEELDVFLKMLGVILTPTEIKEAMKAIDANESDGESLVSLEMIFAWLKKLNLLGEGIDYGDLRSPHDEQHTAVESDSDDQEEGIQEGQEGHETFLRLSLNGLSREVSRLPLGRQKQSEHTGGASGSDSGGSKENLVTGSELEHAAATATQANARGKKGRKKAVEHRLTRHKSDANGGDAET